MQNLIKAVLNTLIVSIPEEFVWICLSLIFLKRFEVLDWRRWKKNYKWFLITVVFSASLLNIFKYIIQMNKLASFWLIDFIICLSIIYLYKKRNLIDNIFTYLKIIFFTFVCDLIIGICEIIYMPLVLSVIHKTMNDINDNIVSNFLYSIPSRLFQILIIYILWKKNKAQIKSFSFIFKDKLLSIISIAYVIIISIIMFITLNMLTRFNIINNQSKYMQILIGVSVACFPTIMGFVYILPIGRLINKIQRIQQSYENMLDD